MQEVETMKKKTPKTPRLPRREIHRRRRTHEDRKDQGDPIPETMPIIESFFRQDFTFTGRIAFAEKWAMKVLQDANCRRTRRGFTASPTDFPQRISGSGYRGAQGPEPSSRSWRRGIPGTGA